MRTFLARRALPQGRNTESQIAGQFREYGIFVAAESVRFPRIDGQGADHGSPRRFQRQGNARTIAAFPRTAPARGATLLDGDILHHLYLAGSPNQAMGPMDWA